MIVCKYGKHDVLVTSIKFKVQGLYRNAARKIHMLDVVDEEIKTSILLCYFAFHL